MSKIKLLNNVTHKDLKVNPNYSAELGDSIASTITFITEFAEVHKEYPILCRKDPNSGEFQAVVLFGMKKDENIYLSGASNPGQKHPGWDARYIPAVVARGPFSIGVQTQTEAGVEKSVPVIHVDMEHPKVSADEGVQLFLAQGGNSPYLEHVSSILNLIRDGMQPTKLMFDAFQKYELLEDVNIDIELVNEDKHRISGFKTINVDKLQALGGSALEELNRGGFLQAAYFMVASVSNIKHLIDIKNRRLKT